VSSSNPIPDNDDAYEQAQPPHIQARKAYERGIAQVRGRQFIVTMEHPTIYSPEPVVFEISAGGLGRKQTSALGVGILSTSKPPRAG
jgi:hypothetical protein